MLATEPLPFWKGPAKLGTRLGLGIACIVTALLLISAVNLALANQVRSVAAVLETKHQRVSSYLQLATAAWNLQISTTARRRFGPSPSLSAGEAASRQAYAASLDRAIAYARKSNGRPGEADAIARLGDDVKQLLESGRLANSYDRLVALEQNIDTQTELVELWRPFPRLLRFLEDAIERENASIEGRNQRLNNLLRLAGLINIIALALSLALGTITMAIVFRRLGVGLRQVERGAAELAAGNLDWRIDLKGRDELASLSRSLDAMAVQLAEQKLTLQAARDSLAEQVRLRTAELEEANARLARTDEERRNFLTEIGHELRTPLTIIRGEAQLMLRDADDMTDSAEECFSRILDQTVMLGRLIDDLFVIARAQSGGLNFEMSDTDLRQLTGQVVGLFAPLIEDASSSIALAPGPSPIIRCDPDRLRQALVAVVDNATRHGGPHVTILVAVNITPDNEAEVIVSDNGPGVPEELIDKVFDRFVRGRRSTEGSGLGLAVVQALVRAQDGSVSIENLPQAGVMLRIRFPIVDERSVE